MRSFSGIRPRHRCPGARWQAGTLHRLINTLARLSEGETSATYRQTQEAHLKARIQQQLPENAPKAITKETLLNIAKQLKLLPSPD